MLYYLSINGLSVGNSVGYMLEVLETAFLLETGVGSVGNGKGPVSNKTTTCNQRIINEIKPLVGMLETLDATFTL